MAREIFTHTHTGAHSHTLVDMLCHTDFEGHVHRHAVKAPRGRMESNVTRYTLPVASTVTSLIFTSTRHPISFPEHFHKKTTSTKNNKA